MKTSTFSIDGLNGLAVGSVNDAKVIVVLLHGYAMNPEDLEPFAHSMLVPGVFFFPQGPETLIAGGRAWWNIDTQRRAQQIATGPRDLVSEVPANRETLHRHLRELTHTLREMNPATPLVLGGFSQGGMLACDAVLCGNLSVNGLVMLSTSRIAINDWDQHRSRLVNLPVFISHGIEDTDLAFSAGEALRDFHSTSSANVTWVPFEGGHTIPFVVWRRLRHFLLSQAYKAGL